MILCELYSSLNTAQILYISLVSGNWVWTQFLFTITNQFKIYKYCCRKEYSWIIIDATGRVARRLRKPGNKLDGHKFLYLEVVKITRQNGRLLPVVKILSKRHNFNAIAYWLDECLRAEAKRPQYIVDDDSAALISTCSKIFCKESSTAKYLNQCFVYLQWTDEYRQICLLRTDVAHII